MPYKRIDVAIEACRRAGVPLKIVGDGPDRAALERRPAGPTSQFLGRAVRRRRARPVPPGAGRDLLPGEEDFGIVPLEAQACGRPVVALGRGGALETVIPGETGTARRRIRRPRRSPTRSQRALDRTASTRAPFGAHAERFGRERFGDEMEASRADRPATC